MSADSLEDYVKENTLDLIKRGFYTREHDEITLYENTAIPMTKKGETIFNQHVADFLDAGFNYDEILCIIARKDYDSVKPYVDRLDNRFSSTLKEVAKQDPDALSSRIPNLPVPVLSQLARTKPSLTDLHLEYLLNSDKRHYYLFKEYTENRLDKLKPLIKTMYTFKNRFTTNKDYTFIFEKFLEYDRELIREHLPGIIENKNKKIIEMIKEKDLDLLKDFKRELISSGYHYYFNTINELIPKDEYQDNITDIVWGKKNKLSGLMLRQIIAEEVDLLRPHVQRLIELGYQYEVTLIAKNDLDTVKPYFKELVESNDNYSLLINELIEDDESLLKDYYEKVLHEEAEIIEKMKDQDLENVKPFLKQIKELKSRSSNLLSKITNNS